MDKISLYDGKYIFERDSNKNLHCLRYGEIWRDFIGDNAVNALFSYAIELEAKVIELDKTVDAFDSRSR
jgi:hypothetical protein